MAKMRGGSSWSAGYNKTAKGRRQRYSVELAGKPIDDSSSYLPF